MVTRAVALWWALVLIGMATLSAAHGDDRFRGDSPYQDRPYWERHKIRLTAPNSHTRWQHGDKNRTWSWDPSTVRGKVRFELWRGRQRVADLKRPVENDGEARLDEPVQESWGSGSNFYIVAIDNRDRIGVSDRFTIFGGICVLQPSDVTLWRTGEKDKLIRWDSETAKGKVRIELLKGGSVITELKAQSSNDGEARLDGRVSEDWPSGSDYRIRVTDHRGKVGVSDTFRIERIDVPDRKRDADRQDKDKQDDGRDKHDRREARKSEQASDEQTAAAAPEPGAAQSQDAAPPSQPQEAAPAEPGKRENRRQKSETDGDDDGRAQKQKQTKTEGRKGKNKQADEQQEPPQATP